MQENLCAKCKGKGYCGRSTCPILEKFKSIKSSLEIKKDTTSIFGASPPAVFIGRYNYPNVMSGPMIPPGIGSSEASALEDVDKLLKMNISEIIEARSKLIRTGISLNVKDATDPKNTLLLKSQELALSSDPIDTEAWLNKPVINKLKFDSILTPMGPSADLKNLDITENPHVPKKIDYLIYDNDILAKDAISELNSSKISQEHITRLLSIGLLGKERKLVPTRWSITAVDDILSKKLITNIKDYQQINDIMLFNGTIFGNHFEILLIPNFFAYELTEIWMPQSVWSKKTFIAVDGENERGKKGYSNLAGGYYAARISILEHLKKIRRQATVYAIREITPDYWAPLGVWVVREAAHEALSKSPQKFTSLSSALNMMSSRLKTPMELWKPKSKLINNFSYQKTLDLF